jgi:predicted kinase
MQELVIFIGLQGSGKSTFYNDKFAATHQLVSKDRLRNNSHRQQRQMQLLAEHLSAGQSVVIDNTNPTTDDRLPLIEEGHRVGAQIVGYYFSIPLKICMERNQHRKGIARVPDVAIFATNKRLCPPSYEEGFDQIYVVTINPEEQCIITFEDNSHGP